MRKNSVRPVHVVFAHILIGLFLMIVFAWGATPVAAFKLGHQPQLGVPWFVIKGYPVYFPWMLWLWSFKYHAYAPHIFNSVQWTVYGSFILVIVAIPAMAVRRCVSAKPSGTHGTARWAVLKDIEAAGLTHDEGVVLAQSDGAVFVSRPGKDGVLAWKMKKHGKRLITHNGPEHVFCFAPTRSGKGVGMVVPTLLSWRGSALIYDIKRENWEITSGWRSQFSHCLKFDPTATDSIRFNPLFEIRKGAQEVKDVQSVSDMIVDPSGEKTRLDHWEKTAHSLLVGTILHLLYAGEEKTLRGLGAFLSDPGRTISETLEIMRTTNHLGHSPHPVVAGCAMEMLNKAENELSGVVSTAMSFLGLYKDPVIAENTSASDFRISDLMHAQRPVSLYLVVPPSDIDRTNGCGTALFFSIKPSVSFYTKHTGKPCSSKGLTRSVAALYRGDWDLSRAFNRVGCWLIGISVFQLMLRPLVFYVLGYAWGAWADIAQLLISGFFIKWLLSKL